MKNSNMQSPRPEPRVTMRVIAQRLKISHTTVSRALKDDPRISESVREQVKAAARNAGYTPDPMLSALAHYRRSQTMRPIGAELAWINCWPEPKRFQAFREFELYWRGAREQAEQAGYRLESFNCPTDVSPARLQKILRARNIRGLLFTPAWARVLPDWTGLNWDDFSMVRFGYSLDAPKAHVVTSAQMFDGKLAYQRIRQKGYRRIGLVFHRNVQALFRAGYLLADIDENDAQRIPPLALEHTSDPAAKAEQKAFRAWMKQHKPDAILSDLPDLPAWLASAGYRIPQDVAFASFSVLDGKSSAGINQNSLEIGRAAVQLLISLIHHNERGIPEICREVQIEGQWVDGGTAPEKRGGS